MNTAKRLADSFYTAENGNVCTDDATALAMVSDANDYGLGFDFSYEAVRDCLQWLAESTSDRIDAEYISDQSGFAADALIDDYDGELSAWFSSAPSKHMALIDDYMEQNCRDEYPGMFELLRNGQYHAYSLTMEAIAANWPDDPEEEEESDEESAE